MLGAPRGLEDRAPQSPKELKDPRPRMGMRQIETKPSGDRSGDREATAFAVPVETGVCVRSAQLSGGEMRRPVGSKETLLTSCKATAN